ncbi:MAG: hypothetical protein MN733_14985 [Nitrososphaera sp.]|nr:hypothetical protein [Nitrososphaera sp.]
MNSNGDSGSDRLLYSYHKALDDVLNLGAIPQRLFRIFYPVWRVHVEGRQRVPQDFEELEWFIERGLHQAKLSSIEQLSQFFGLKKRFVEKLVHFLQGINHIKNDQGQLVLTELGQESVQQRVRILEQDTSAMLYFDGFGSKPLSRGHYQIPFYSNLPGASPFRAIHNFSKQWDKKELLDLLNRSDREQFGIWDEVMHLEPVRPPDLVYLPVYIVQHRHKRQDLLPYLTYSRVRNMRDTTLEEIVNRDPLIRVPLRDANQNDLAPAVEQLMSQRGLGQNDYYLQHEGPWGPQVMVDAGAIKRLEHRQREDEENRLLTIGNIGRYLLAREWCVWITCDDAEVRQQAGIEQLLEWLQHVSATPTIDDLQQRLKVMVERLRIQPISVDTLTNEATQRGLGRALERLDALVISSEAGEEQNAPRD